MTIRKGMWGIITNKVPNVPVLGPTEKPVYTDGNAVYPYTDLPAGTVGIVAAINWEELTCEFHQVKDDGTTLKRFYEVPVTEIAQCSLHDIPEARRPEPEHGAKFGYA